MTKEDKELFEIHGFKEAREDLNGNIVDWRKEYREKNIEIHILADPDGAYDISLYDTSETENKGIWKTLFNSAEDVETAVEFADNWAVDNGYTEDMDTVKPVFEAKSRKLAEDIAELERSIDEEGYDKAFPTQQDHINNMVKDLQSGNIQYLLEYLHTFTLQEAEAERKLAEMMMQRLHEYDSFRTEHIQNYNVAAEMAVEDNYNNIDGIIGNSAPKEEKKEHHRINIKDKIKENREKLGLTGEAPAQGLTVEGQLNRN